MRADKDTIEFHRDASLYDSEDDGSDLFASDPSRAHRTRSPAPHHHDRRHGFEPHRTGARDRGRARMPWSDDDASGRHRQPRNSSLDRWEDYFEDDDEDEEPWIYDSDPGSHACCRGRPVLVLDYVGRGGDAGLAARGPIPPSRGVASRRGDTYRAGRRDDVAPPGWGGDGGEDKMMPVRRGQITPRGVGGGRRREGGGRYGGRDGPFY
ncbi:MAG: hypothetical protein Q9196_007472 [Gyalolechia fulgens]